MRQCLPFGRSQPRIGVPVASGFEAWDGGRFAVGVKCGVAVVAGSNVVEGLLIGAAAADLVEAVIQETRSLAIKLARQGHNTGPLGSTRAGAACGEDNGGARNKRTGHDGYAHER